MSGGLLLIHAFPLDARMWDAQRAGRPALAPSLPGFGGSPVPAGGVLTMEAAASRCLRALDDAGVERAVVCGLSMGGYVALALWRSAPERIAGLVLANTRSEADPPEGAENRRALAERLLREGNVLADAPPPLLSEDAPDSLRQQVRSWIADQSPEGIAAAALGMAGRPDATADLERIDVPTLVITSDHDALIPAEVSAPMADRIPGARLAVIERAGHLSNLEQPAVFGGLLDEHLGRCGIAV
jgi:3-oxoadipate enol-lactonase